MADPPKFSKSPKPPEAPPTDFWFEVLILLTFIAVFGFGLIVLLYAKVLSLRFLLIALLNRLRPVGITVDIALVVGIIYALIQNFKIRTKFTLLGPLPSTKQTEVAKDPEIIKLWSAILARAASNKPDDTRLAIIEADALVDGYLKKVGYEGEHMADRLSQILPEEVGSLEALWRAHRLRNEIVHTAGFTMTPDEAKNALRSFEMFLEDLGAL